MNRRIYGEENELGAILKNKEGHYEPAIEKSSGIPNSSVWNPLFQRRYNELVSAGAFLENGAKIYVDLEHVECATAEASLARDVVLNSKGCERLIEEVLSRPGPEGRIIMIKDNTDSSSDYVTFACHENYFYYDSDGRVKAASDYFNRNFLSNFMIFMASRIPITGGGVIAAGDWREKGIFYLSHRTRFIDTEVAGSSHQEHSPFITTKQEPLVGSTKCPFYHRLHITGGDPNISEYAQYLKYGITGLAVRLAEDNALPFSEIDPVHIVGSARVINWDLTFQRRLITLSDGRSMRPIDVQRIFLKAAKQRYPADNDPSDVAAETADILEKWGEILDELEVNSPNLAKKLDHAILRKIMARITEREGFKLEEIPELVGKDPANGDRIVTILKSIEQQYHELSPRSIYRMMVQKGLVARILTDKEIAIAKTEPPGFFNPKARTRSWARGKIVQAAVSREKNVSGDWTYMSYGSSENSQKVGLEDPFEWNRKDIGEFIKFLSGP